MTYRSVLSGVRTAIGFTAVFLLNITASGPVGGVRASSNRDATSPQSAFQVTSAGMKADAYENFGPCPITVGFGGWITTNGPGTVRYTSIRSDGAIAPEETLSFERAETKMVRTTWTLGRGYKGWQAIKILSPNETESSHAEFLVKCDGPPSGGVPPLSVEAKADSYINNGPCPVTVGVGALIKANGACAVTYTFIRSDGASGPKYSVTFESAGSKIVHTTWALGRSYEGWVGIKILSPVSLESNHAAFIVDCGKTGEVRR
ncbi:MAG TPA: hypothetical protein VFV34_11365 [Blastocatellia bacterium]|nr:hypothetical protein [Blastocatellia bacterium]